MPQRSEILSQRTKPAIVKRQRRATHVMHRWFCLQSPHLADKNCSELVVDMLFQFIVYIVERECKISIQKELTESRVPVKIWTDDIDELAQKQLFNIATLPFIHHHVAAMPDVHVGIGATVGSVIATHKAIIPPFWCVRTVMPGRHMGVRYTFGLLARGDVDCPA